MKPLFLLLSTFLITIFPGVTKGKLQSPFTEFTISQADVVLLIQLEARPENGGYYLPNVEIKYGNTVGRRLSSVIFEKSIVLKGEVVFPVQCNIRDFLIRNQSTELPTQTALVFLRKDPDNPGQLIAKASAPCLESSRKLDIEAIKASRDGFVDEFIRQAFFQEKNPDLLAKLTNVIVSRPDKTRQFCWEHIKNLSLNERDANAMPFLVIGLSTVGAKAFDQFSDTAKKVSKLDKFARWRWEWSIQTWVKQNKEKEYVPSILKFAELQEGDFRNALVRGVADAAGKEHVPELLDILSKTKCHNEFGATYYSIRQALDESAGTPSSAYLKNNKSKYLWELREMLEEEGLEMPKEYLWK